MSKNNGIALVIGIVIVAGAATIAFSQKKSAPVPTTSSTQETTNSSSTLPSYALAQVAEHGETNGCWTSINGAVYDLNAWIAKHPGGDKNIFMICGKDGSSAFDNQHGGERKPEKILAGFQIGTLTK
jgi:cytochrome b involved in lipid metabolism